MPVYDMADRSTPHTIAQPGAAYEVLCVSVPQ